MEEHIITLTTPIVQATWIEQPWLSWLTQTWSYILFGILAFVFGCLNAAWFYLILDGTKWILRQGYENQFDIWFNMDPEE